MNSKGKHIFVSIIVAGAFSTSMQAACNMTDIEASCMNFYVGGGAMYQNGRSSNTEIQDITGYVTLGLEEVVYNVFKIGVDFKAGYGINTLNGANLANFNKENRFLQGEIVLRGGFNILLNPVIPLYINFIGGIDNYIAGSAIRREFYFIGGLLEGKIPVAETLWLTYSGGYGAIMKSIYHFGDGANRVDTELLGKNHLFLASLGIQKQFSEKLGFYFKTLGKYYDLQASKEVQYNNTNVVIPAMNTWQVSLEMGLIF